MMREWRHNDAHSYRFFNDTELRSTQKQTIAVKQNIHTLTVNRADLTDAGEFLVNVS